jgi:hypothetical protein
MLDALYIDRYWRYLRAFVSHGLDDRFIATSFIETAPAIAANPMFDLLGVRYLVFDASSAGPPAWSYPQYRLVYRDAHVKIYENSHVMPRAFVVHRAHEVDGATAAIRYLRSGESTRFPDGSVQVGHKDMRHSAVVEGKVPGLGVGCSSAGDGASVIERTSTKVTVRVHAACPGLLVLSDSYYPGWSADVDGRSVPVYATDVALRGVPVPAGASTVTFRYRPESFRIGVIMTFAGVLVLVVLALGGFFSSAWWTRRSAERSRVPGIDVGV